MAGTADFIKVEQGKLMVAMKLDEKGAPSKTGKTTIHGSTHGFVRIDGTQYRVSILVTKEA